jgi:tRNA1(Val) A37 N6-methylase TrmN6
VKKPENLNNNLKKIFEIASCEKKYYQKCQVYTPTFIVKQLWKMLHEEKEKYERVLDLGAGDGKFSQFGNYNEYLGIEIDELTHPIALPKCASIKNICAFALEESDFDLCIGNPPYVRHQELEIKWKQKYSKILSKQLNEKFSQRSNIFVYFLAQSLLKTSKTGKVALVIPFEWVTRPSSQSIRNYIDKNNWSVKVYRFKDDIFPKVLTTASITIIDKSCKNNTWEYFEINKDFITKKTKQPTGTTKKILEYQNRIDSIYAQRGLSPGNQKIFCLTEEERIKHNLEINKDVLPCIVSLKPLSKEDKTLTKKVFFEKYVNNGQRCWLVNSYCEDISPNLKTYFNNVPFEARNTWTCNNREIWWKFPSVKAPKVLYSSAFTKYGPKIVVNRVNAISVNSAFGIYANSKVNLYKLVDYIKLYDFESRIVNHSGHLKRIEVNQMNSVIYQYLNKAKND